MDHNRPAGTFFVQMKVKGKGIESYIFHPLADMCVKLGQSLNNCTTLSLFQFIAVTSPVIAPINEAYHWH
jgi:hypothetical protein